MSEDKVGSWLDMRKSMAPIIRPEKCGLLIIDMQEYQVRKGWPAYKLSNSIVPGMLDYFMRQTAEVAEPNIGKLIACFRQHGLKIIYTMYSSFQKDGEDLAARTRFFNAMATEKFGGAAFPYKDHPASRIVDTLKPEETDLIVIKNTSSVFTATKLEFLLRNMGIEQLFVTGVVTNMCVEGSARTAGELGFEVFIIDDACAAWSEQIHKNTLQSFSLLFGHVLTTQEAIARVDEKMGG